MKNIMVSFLIGILFGLGIALQAQESGMAFLKIGVGARALAVGNAVTATVQGPAAVYWNPGGLVNQTDVQVLVHHNQWVFGSNSEFLALSGGNGHRAWGVFVQTFFIDGIQVRENASPEPLAETNAVFFTTGVAYARRITHRLSAGGTLKYLFQKIYVEQASGWAVDAGLQYQLASHWQLGAVVQNAGKMAVLANESTPLPTTVRAGVAWQWAMPSGPWAVQLSGDAVKFRGQSPVFSLGGEVRFAGQLALRGGLLMGYATRRWTAGLGISKSWVQFHYALVPFTRNLGVAHQFSVLLRL